MSTKLISLAKCPFCPRGSAILVNSEALRSYHRTHRKWEHLLIHKCPDQELFAFTSERPGQGPCEHLVQLYGKVHYSIYRPTNNDRRTGGLDFDWCHQHFDRPKFGFEACEYLWEVIVNNTEPSELQPKTPVCYKRFRRESQMTIPRTEVSQSFYVQGGVVFAKDVPALFAALPGLIDKRDAHFGNPAKHATPIDTELVQTRANRAAQAILAVGYDDAADLFEAVSDLMTDLHHLADQHSLDLYRPVNLAESKYGDGSEELSDARTDVNCDVTSHDDDYEYDDVEVEEEIDNASSAENLSFKARQAKPLNEQTLDEFDDFFRRFDDLTFLFLSYGADQVNTVFPNAIHAIALADAALLQTDYQCPYPRGEATAADNQTKRVAAQATFEIEARVEEMHRRGAEFVFLRRWGDDKRVRVDCSSTLADHADDLVEYIAEEVRDYLHC